VYITQKQMSVNIPSTNATGGEEQPRKYKFLDKKAEELGLEDIKELLQE
jgi:hypothetical protein